METILSGACKKITEGKQRGDFQKFRWFSFPPTQLFWWHVWYLLYSSDTHIAAPSTSSLSFSTKRISHSQNPSSIGLALRDSDALTYFDANWYSVESLFFSFTFVKKIFPLHLQPVQQQGEHHWPKSINWFHLQIYCKTCEALNKYVH